MENTSKDTLINSDNSTNIDSAPRVATPHFDEQSIQSARPAVPLERIKARRFWRLSMVFICGSILVGGLIAIIFLRYRNRSVQISTPTASVAPERKSQNESPEPLSQSIASPEARPKDAGLEPSEGNAGAARAAHVPEGRSADANPMRDSAESDSRATLQAAFDEWIAATNARDIQRHMDFYNQTVNAFYLTRNVPREAVRAEKSRVFGRAGLIDIRAAAPGIHLSPDGRTATMLFRKKYAIEGGGEDRRGEVLQELRWRRTAGGWKIVSERDLRVIH
jgi:ketosteroid isomerase-like protein